MSKAFKSVGKVLKKAAPVLGGIGGFALGGPLGAALGAGLGTGAARGFKGPGLLGRMAKGGLIGGGIGLGASFLPSLLGGGIPGIAGAGQFATGAGGGGGIFSNLLGNISGLGGLGTIASSVLGTGQGMFGTSINPLQLAGFLTGLPAERQAQRRLSETGDIQRSLLGQAQGVGGLSPEARRLMLERAKEQIRASQAERGIFQSGPAAAFEAEQLPLIEAQMNQLALQNLLQTSGAYGNIY